MEISINKYIVTYLEGTKNRIYVSNPKLGDNVELFL
jgi:hypothetical protein